jgi:TetR/AcrR family transcriptional regulator, regulator of autoinduction and epiphytic fitness
MARTVKGKAQKRSYDSSKRQEQAKATRAAVLDAARELFVRQGFTATTLQAVAEEAGVSVQTGSKPELLRQLIGVAVVGDDEAVPLIEREAVQRIASERDQHERARMQAALITQILGRVAPVAMVAREASGASADAAEQWRAFMVERHKGMAHAARTLAGKDGLRVKVAEAADIIHALWSPELYTILVRELGWSSERYQAWMADTLERTLLPD